MRRIDLHKQAVNDPNVTATVLLVIAADHLGTDLLTWDPETIKMEVDERFGKFPVGNFNKLMAAIEITTTNSFYSELPAFIRLCNVLYNGTFDPREFDPADAGELAWGLTESLLLWPPDSRDDNPFASDIVKYISKALDAEGIMVPPDILRLGTIDKQMKWDEVQGAFSDDPGMFNAIYDMEKQKTEEINKMVKDRLKQMLHQLETLELDNGSTKDLIERMQGTLSTRAKASDKLRPHTP